MGKIIVNENVSIDGVFQDPTAEEGVGREDWRARFIPADLEAWSKAFSADGLAAEALLLGRGSYEFFAARYPSRTGEWADKLNAMPKYVVSATLQNPGWNASVLKGDVVDAVSKLKQQMAGDIVVYASSGLVPTLIEHDLVDKLRLMVYPVVVGTGKQLFDKTNSNKYPRLVETRTVGDSLAFLTYEFATQ